VARQKHHGGRKLLTSWQPTSRERKKHGGRGWGQDISFQGTSDILSPTRLHLLQSDHLPIVSSKLESISE
jgi:hypothetical protein